MIVAVIGFGLLVPCAAGPAVADDLRAVDAVGAEEECLAQVIRADGPDLLAVGAGDALVVTTFFTFTRPAPCSRGENSAPVLLVPGTAESFSDRRAADRDTFAAGDAAASDRAHAQPRLGASAGGLFRAIPAAACPLHPRHSGPRGGASGRIRRCRRADAGGAGRGTHRLHAAVRDAAFCARPDARLPQRRFFQRHRPVSRHDLPPHELARVRRVHPRGQAEPARLQP